MSAPHQRVPLVPLDEYWAIAREKYGAAIDDVAPTQVLNIARIWAHHPTLMLARRGYQLHLRHDSPLPRREHELAVLRTGWRCRSEYEFSQHVVFGRKAGLTDEEIHRVTLGPDAEGWAEKDALLLRTADELYDDNKVSDATWAGLTAHYDTAQIIELLTLIGHYWMVAVVANSLGIPLEDGRPGFPA